MARKKLNIIPSIVAEDIMELEAKLKQVEGLVSWVHIDVVDGKFAKNKTWPYNQDDIDREIRDFGELRTSVNLGVHLMVSDPEKNLDEWIDTEVKRISVHDESCKDIENILAIVDMSKTKSCVVLKMETPVAELEHLIERVDAVQLMSINSIGNYGEKFDPDVIKKIQAVKKKYPKKELIVDGGVNEDNIREVAKAGADSVVVGSAIWKSANVEEAIKYLESLV